MPFNIRPVPCLALVTLLSLSINCHALNEASRTALTITSSEAHKHHTFSIPTASTAPTSASAPAIDHGKEHIEYSTVKGFFLQDLDSTDPTTFDYTAVNFGLINQTYKSDKMSTKGDTQWQRFNRLIRKKNQKAHKNVVYKLLFIGRHGEGEHNAAEDFYGTPAWNCYYAEFDGNATNKWSDARLTSNGVAEAQQANKFWKHEMKQQKITPPQSYYVSPLTRCLKTAQLTYGSLALPAAHAFVPTVKEFFREAISIHTCDRRSSRSSIQRRFPHYRLDASLTEHDELWNGVTAETASARGVRSKIALDQLFRRDASSIVSITTHSGEAAALLDVLGHREFPLNTGEIIPVLVRAETVAAPPAPTSTAPWTPSSWCVDAPPVTSQTTGASACVCSGGEAPVATTATVKRAPAPPM